MYINLGSSSFVLPPYICINVFIVIFSCLYYLRHSGIQVLQITQGSSSSSSFGGFLEDFRSLFLFQNFVDLYSMYFSLFIYLLSYKEQFFCALVFYYLIVEISYLPPFLDSWILKYGLFLQKVFYFRFFFYQGKNFFVSLSRRRLM